MLAAWAEAELNAGTASSATPAASASFSFMGELQLSGAGFRRDCVIPRVIPALVSTLNRPGVSPLRRQSLRLIYPPSLRSICSLNRRTSNQFLERTVLIIVRLYWRHTQ